MLMVMIGTTSRMLEVMGIRTGVQEEEESSSEEEERAWVRSGRLGPVGARWNDSPASNRRRWSRSTPHPRPTHPPQTIIGSHGRSSSINTAPSVTNVFDISSDSEGNEVLPMSRSQVRTTEASYNHHHQTSTAQTQASQSFPPTTTSNLSNGQRQGSLVASSSRGSLRQAGEAWFHAIDERYLLPLFSNAVASRTFHAKRANRRATIPQQHPFEGEDVESDGFDGFTDSPRLRDASLAREGRTDSERERDNERESLLDGVGGAVKRKNQEVLRSIGSFWRGPGRREGDEGGNASSSRGSPARGSPARGVEGLPPPV